MFSKKSNSTIKLGIRCKIQKIDIKAGYMTFSQRIELGKILTSNNDDLFVAIKIIDVLHGFKPNNSQLIKLHAYIESILEGILYWAKAESIMLKYTPTPEERQAGIMDLSKKIGDLSTADALAQKYGMDPDDVLAWSYSKVFGILYADLETSKFRQKHRKILQKNQK